MGKRLKKVRFNKDDIGNKEISSSENEEYSGGVGEKDYHDNKISDENLSDLEDTGANTREQHLSQSESEDDSVVSLEEEEDSEQSKEEEGSQSEQSDQNEQSNAEDSDSDISDSEVKVSKKRKKSHHDDSGSFSKAFSAIVGSHLKAHDRKDPIMARNRTTLKKLDSDKIEKKAKRELLLEKKSLREKHRVKSLLPSANEPEKVRGIIDHERKLKRVAQKGVVQLFNAILNTQLKTSSRSGDSTSGNSSGEKKRDMDELSKEQFLDLVHAAGQS